MKNTNLSSVLPFSLCMNHPFILSLFLLSLSFSPSFLVHSQDCLEWKILPHVDEALCLKSSLLQGRFTGDPSFIVEHKVTNKVGIGDDTAEKTTSVSIYNSSMVEPLYNGHLWYQ